MKLFPYTLIRFGGGPFNSFNNHSYEEILEIKEKILALNNQINSIKTELSEDLLTFIKTLKDTRAQKKLQNLRRNIFNERNLNENNLSLAEELLPQELKDKLYSYIQVKNSINDLTNQGEEKYEKEILKGRDKLKELAKKENIQKGLLLSSQSLLKRINSYCEKKPETYKKKEYQTEISLLKYLTRIYTKTSPFSTFTNLTQGKFEEIKQDLFQFSHLNNESKVKSHIRLNNFLFKYLKDLLVNYRPAYLQLPIRPNPTIEKKEDHFLYLVNFNNIESFQRIPFNPVIELFLEMTKEEKDGILFHSLITQAQEQVDASEEELESYIKQLIDFGFLEYNIGVSGINPDWDLSLIEKLEPIANKKIPYVQELISTLIEVRKQAEYYGNGSVEKRKECLQKAFDTFKNICMQIHEAAGLPADERKSKEEIEAEQKIKKQEKDSSEEKNTNNENEEFKQYTSTFFNFNPEQIFYEDTTREAKAILNKEATHSLIEKIDALLHETKLFQAFENEKLKMADYFIKKYDKNHTVNLLTFYEDFYRDVKKAEAETELKKEESKKENKEKEQSKKEEKLPLIPGIEKRNKLIDQWNDKGKELLKDKIKNNQEIVNISLETIQKINQSIQLDTSRKKNSFGSFIQFYQTEESNRPKLMGVFNASFAGYGKMTSRFLHILDPQMTTQTRQNNLELEEDMLLIENCDASYFNANLHPPLLPYEIWMPGGHNSLPAKQQIPITDLEVKFNTSNEKLILVHKPTNKQALIFDLGFQSLMGRSQLFQLLEKFTKAEYLFSYPVTSLINQVIHESDSHNEDNIVFAPRIIYENQIILQRKSWLIPKTVLPNKTTEDSNWQYFLKVNSWRKQYKMPDEVFIYINPNRGNNDNIDPELLKKLGRDDYKPQYINFNNPLLINLLEKLINKVPTSLKIEEMLPNSRQMTHIDQEKYVSEYVVQWYNK